MTADELELPLVEAARSFRTQCSTSKAPRGRASSNVTVRGLTPLKLYLRLMPHFSATDDDFGFALPLATGIPTAYL